MPQQVTGLINRRFFITKGGWYSKRGWMVHGGIIGGRFSLRAMLLCEGVRVYENAFLILRNAAKLFTNPAAQQTDHCCHATQAIVCFCPLVVF